jgi:hypothetical protein
MLAANFVSEAKKLSIRKGLAFGRKLLQKKIEASYAAPRSYKAHSGDSQGMGINPKRQNRKEQALFHHKAAAREKAPLVLRETRAR